jgi:hypothetical protein
MILNIFNTLIRIELFLNYIRIIFELLFFTRQIFSESQNFPTMIECTGEIMNQWT